MTAVTHIRTLTAAQKTALQKPGSPFVYIGRANGRAGLRKSKWANPYPVTAANDRSTVIAAYSLDWLAKDTFQEKVKELAGKILVCWCKPEACHGDFLAHAADSAHSEVLWQRFVEDTLQKIEGGN